MTPKIYTKTGDKGMTSLFGGTRVSKADVRVEAYGTVDELNSAIGIAVSVLSIKYQVSSIRRELIAIQNDLLAIGSFLASPTGVHSSQFTVHSLEKRTKEHEALIDNLTKALPPLQNFILPGGGRAGAQLHLCRTFCRRAERRIVALAKKEPVSPEILQYFNRLSDLLFTMARFVNFKEKKKEIIWKK